MRPLLGRRGGPRVLRRRRRHNGSRHRLAGARTVAGVAAARTRGGPPLVGRRRPRRAARRPPGRDRRAARLRRRRPGRRAARRRPGQRVRRVLRLRRVRRRADPAGDRPADLRGRPVQRPDDDARVVARSDRQPGRRRHRRPARPARTATRPAPGRGTTRRATATRSAPSPLDLPAPPDLLPSALGRRLLSEATDDELSRIGARRVAGRDALGLRLTPADDASSVSRVDVWVDGDSGLPLQVEVFGEGRRTARARHPVPRPRARRPAGRR